MKLKKTVSAVLAGAMLLGTSAFAKDNIYAYNKFISTVIGPQVGYCDFAASFAGLENEYDNVYNYFSGLISAFYDDIDMDFVKLYTNKIDYGKSPLEYLKENRGFIKEKDGEIQISTAVILLFGKNPQNFFPRARIRFIRYEGTEEKFGTEMNVIKDVIFEGTLLYMINEAIAYLDTQVKVKNIT